ncbi:MAG: M20/M25/M40 family metallo-hydrolase [Nannocystaceae bacterium]|nr:M20/M25/M40 family metallo-hydrolase [bacterium]
MQRWLVFTMLAACSEPSESAEVHRVVPELELTVPKLEADTLRRYTAALADERMQGRGTASAGGRRAKAWIAARMEELGLDVQRQRVPLIAYETTVREMNPDAIVHSELASGSHAKAWPLVDAGYGIVAPEYGWNDYEGLPVGGAVVVVRSGEPPMTGSFEGDALTEHGRWTTKLERARTQGAAGCLIVHDPRGAGYPWSVVQASFSGARFAAAPGPSQPLQIWGWTEEMPDASRLRATFEQRVHDIEEHNIVGRVGSGVAPFVVVTAHWDHLGTGPAGTFNGAMDNASGVAALLVLARAVKERHATKPLVGTVVFAATAAEEVGLLGARTLAASMHADDVVAAINLDGMNVGPVTPTVELVAPGRSTLDDLFATAVGRQGRRVLGDQSPSGGAAFRSDHAPFAARGIPTLYPQPGYSTSANPALLAFGTQRARRYHTTDDDYDPSWSFEGAVADAKAIYEVIVDLADAEVRPRRVGH